MVVAELAPLRISESPQQSQQFTGWCFVCHDDLRTSLPCLCVLDLLEGHHGFQRRYSLQGTVNLVARTYREIGSNGKVCT